MHAEVERIGSETAMSGLIVEGTIYFNDFKQHLVDVCIDSERLPKMSPMAPDLVWCTLARSYRRNKVGMSLCRETKTCLFRCRQRTNAIIKERPSIPIDIII